MPALGADVVALLHPRAGERILDLGCGDGSLTQRIADVADVVAVDASPAMVDAARRRGLDARIADGAALDFQAEFDAVFSNAALHWMRPPREVIAGVARALRPGGRFVAECGGHGNVAAIRTALRAVLARHGIDAAARDPWFFPSVERYRALLRDAGFTVDAIELIPRPTPLPTDLAGWLETFAAPFFAELEARTRAETAAEAVALVRPALHDGDRWVADHVRLRFSARR